ncbi:MAG: hypothetical protein QNI86_11880 [Halieaceae bacterium]|nr:hypothetical protein [Halieaceae bacterium]
MEIVDRDTEAEDSATIAVLLERAKNGVPNLLATKERIDGGDTLSDLEIADLEEIFERARHMIHVYDEHPEVQDLVAKIMSLYLHITTQAVKNEEALQAPPTVNLDD